MLCIERRFGVFVGRGLQCFFLFISSDLRTEELEKKYAIVPLYLEP
jgi:hypothetical protein